MRHLTILLSLMFIMFIRIVCSLSAEEAADTLLILKNGAEVRGILVEMKDGEFRIRLADGRVMSYPAAEVAEMKRLLRNPEPQTSPTAEVQPQSETAWDPASCEIFVTEKDVDKSLYSSTKEVKVSKKWYGSTSEMYEDVGKKARKMGLDAVIKFHTWHAPSGFAWAAPHAGGVGLKWNEAGRKELPALQGRCCTSDLSRCDDRNQPPETIPPK